MFGRQSDEQENIPCESDDDLSSEEIILKIK